MSLENRVAVITGATGNLGRVVAREFAEQGARLALFGRSIERLREAASELGLPDSRYLLGSTDFTDADSVQAASDAVIERFGRVDILVHLVGGFTGGKSVVEAPSDDVSEMLNQHVWSTFHLAQAFVPHLLANEWGRLIAVSSPLAMSPPGNNSPYAIGKAGQEVIMLSLAQELAGTGVTSNVILVRSIGQLSNLGHVVAREFAEQGAQLALFGRSIETSSLSQTSP